jgi:hypothetical protein
MFATPDGFWHCGIDFYASRMRGREAVPGPPGRKGPDEQLVSPVVHTPKRLSWIDLSSYHLTSQQGCPGSWVVAASLGGLLRAISPGPGVAVPYDGHRPRGESEPGLPDHGVGQTTTCGPKGAVPARWSIGSTVTRT